MHAMQDEHAALGPSEDHPAALPDRLPAALPDRLHDELPTKDHAWCAQVLAQFARDGYVVLPALVPTPVVEQLRGRIDAIMLGAERPEGLFFQLDAASGQYGDAPLGVGWQGPSRDYRKIEKLERDPLFRAFLTAPLFEGLVHAKMPVEVSVYRVMLMNKGPSGGSFLPWHQDGGSFWGLDRDPDFQIWTALDDAPLDGGCLEVVPGSHAGGLATTLGGVIPSELVEGRALDIKVLPVRAGDVVLIHNHLWHRSQRGRQGQSRRALSVCYMPSTTRCVRKKRAPRTFEVVFGKPQPPSLDALGPSSRAAPR